MNIDTLAPQRGMPHRPTPSRLGRALEVVLLILLFFPITALAVLVTGGHSVMQASFVHTALALIVRDAAMVVLVLLFVGWRHEPLASIGWSGRTWGKEVLIGFGMYALMLAVIAVVEIVLTRSGVSGPSHMPKGFTPADNGELVLAAALVVVVAISEETVFRGYLLSRLTYVTRSAPAAVVISSFLFALGHGYEGLLGVIVVGVIGVFLSLVVLWRKTLTAAIVMHFCQDFLGLVLAPALAGHALWPFSH